MISDVEELILTCASEPTKLHIREAVRAYEAGAYRLSIVGTYVAVCFDLIDKIRILAAAGDGSAVTLEGQLNNLQSQLDKNDPSAITGLLRFERSLLEEFRDKFDFFGQHEFEEMDRLRTDRNRCAHPTFDRTSLPFSPSAELARLHIRNALVYVLTQQPRQGKAAVEALRALVLSTYFPSEVPEATQRLRSSEFGRAREALVRGFVDDIVFGFVDKNHPYNYKIPPLIALEAAIEINRPIALARARANVDKLLTSTDKEVVRFASTASLRISEIAEGLSEASRVVMKTWIAVEDLENIANVVKRGLGVSWLRDHAMARVPSLTAESYVKLRGDIPPELVSRGAELYASVSNWDEANRVAVHCAMPFVEKFSAADLELIFSRAQSGQADLIGSHSFREFIGALYERSTVGKAELDALTEKYSLEFYRTPTTEAEQA